MQLHTRIYCVLWFVEADDTDFALTLHTQSTLTVSPYQRLHRTQSAGAGLVQVRGGWHGAYHHLYNAPKE